MERQDQMREQNVNLHLHLQHLSEGGDFLNDWIFVESRPIAPGEHNVCPCGQMGLKEHFMIENKINGNRTFVGSECIDNIHPKAKEVNYYIRRLLYQGLQGTYRGMTRNDLVLFSVDSSSGFVKYLPTVKHLNPPVTRNMEGRWYISIYFPKENTMVYGKKYKIHLKTEYKGGRLRFTAV